MSEKVRMITGKEAERILSLNSN